MQYPTQKYFAIVHEKKRTKFIKHIKLILDRRAPGGIEKVKSKLKEYVRGWHNYYAEGIPVTWREKANSLIRRRIRQLLWKQWKNPDNRRKQLIRIGTNIPPLGEFAYSSNSYWCIAKTPYCIVFWVRSHLLN